MQKKKFLQGIIKRHPDGFGFFIPDTKDHPDVYIPRHSMTGIMTNDKVMIEVEPEKGGERFRGEIMRIVSRGTRQVVGSFQKINDKFGIVKDEGHGWGQDLRISMENSMGAKDGQLVAADILVYPEEGDKFLGKVKEIIGDVHEPMNDIRRVVLANNIPEVFPPEVLAEAKNFAHVPDEKDFAGRTDLREKNLITIDGVTAKDFDDAVLVENNEKGFLLFVAIADVSHYVRIGSAIDRCAYERGTSVYFPNFVIPMLPEVLSNGLCSLNPHVPRLCLVAEMQFDFTGEKLSAKFYEAVMESKARVTYGKAQEVIDGLDLPELHHVKENILRCSDLAKILMAKRFRDGSVDLEIPETELEIDASGVPIDVIRSERLFSHRLIEELMLAANVAVAEFLANRDVPALYRIHEPPNEDAIRMLERYLFNFGGKTKLGTGKLQKRLSKALEEFEGKPEAQILHILTLRSMSQAKYHMNNVGHFGLGFDNYTHFTSPIRRYPDLIVHRLLKNQVLQNSPYRLMSEDDLLSAGTFLSACEQRSAKSERQLQSIKKARFMQKFVGQEFDGIISSVTRFGVFVLLREYDCDGLVRLEDLGKDNFEFDEETLCLVGKRSGFKYSIGDTIKILVAAADPLEGKVTFMLAEENTALAKKSGQQHKAQQEKHRSTHQGKKSESKTLLDELLETSPPSNKGRNDKGGKNKDLPRSKKLQFADRSRLGSNETKEADGGNRFKGKSSRKNSQKRGKTSNNRRGLR